MDIFFSPGARAFFTDALHGDAIPDDAVPISADEHRALIAGQSQGRAILAGADGRPCLATIPRQTLAQRRAKAVAQAKREAARRIEAAAPLWRQLNDQRAPSAEGAARLALIDAIRAASDAIEAEIAAATATGLKAIIIASHPLWPAE
ncbi:hypothetical protein [Sphingobium abikonense]|uniref:hypothetical protein n=1 Tax=Sphingobium abikonense TaxID=86193 RepID=UPI000788217A|nr:hypothetical protein [Sphingobium abikonense]